MNPITIFVGPSDRMRALQHVALEVFDALGVSEHEERFSSNYPPDDHYFTASLGTGIVKVYDLDDVKAGYPYCVSLENSSDGAGSVGTLVDPSTLAKSLTARGLRVFVPEGRWFAKDWDGEGTEHAV